MTGFSAEAIPGIPELSPGADLAAVIRSAVTAAGANLDASDLLVIAQKAVSKVEGRIRRLSEVQPRPEALRLAESVDKDPRLIEVILAESVRIVRIRGDVLITETHHGWICANAGVDLSNVDGGESVTLLPHDPDRSARRLARALGCGVIISDTFGRPWRAGLIDCAIGVAAAPSTVDLRGRTDRSGRALEATVMAVADAVAAAAGLLMEKDSGTPVVRVRGLRYVETGGSSEDLQRPLGRDLFR